jgi:hypothetical protein
MDPKQLATIAQNEGFQVWSDTASHPAPLGYKFVGFYMHTAVQFSGIDAEGVDTTHAAAFAALTHPAERYIPAVCSSFKLASGTVIAFLRKE